MAYAKTGNRQKMEATIKETYQKFPDYLFAITSYGQLCLVSGETGKISEILKKKYSLSELYPSRHQFHVTEAMAFYQLLGNYFCKIGQHKLAKEQLHILEKIAPHAPATESLKAEIQELIAAHKHH